MPADAFMSWGWRVPFLLSVVVIVAGYFIQRNVEETPVFAKQNKTGVSRSPALEAIKYCWPDMMRVMCVALMNTVATVATIFGAAYAVQPAYGIGFHSDVYLWIPVIGNTVAVVLIPFVGNLSDRIGRRIPIIVGALGSGVLSYGYLYAISVHNVPLAIVASIMMWGVVYQGYNAIFPSFYPEMFPARIRVSAVAIAQNIGTMLTAMMPAVFAIVAPPGSNVPMIVGSLTFGVAIIATIAAYTARETYRLRLEDLGNKNASPIPSAEYERIRLEALASRR
jgi:MFS family permease